MKITLKELATKVNIPIGTVRSWTLKPIEGQSYDPKKINYKALCVGIRKYVNDETFAEKFGCTIEEVEIVKSERTNHEYLECVDLIAEKEYIIHNYSLETKVTFIGTHPIEDDNLYLFKSDKGYKAYATAELIKSNIKIEEA